jgi:hypothetical protein
MSEYISNDMSLWRRFAIVVDGEVAEIVSFPPENERQVAIYSSSPQIIEATESNTLGLLGPLLGSTWNGTEFVATEGE